MLQKTLFTAIFFGLGLWTTMAVADPFSALSVHAQALKQYSPDELVMVGSISHGNDVLGIVKTPDNSVYTVKPGSEIGNSAYVVNVTPEQITVSQHAKMMALTLRQVE